MVSDRGFNLLAALTVFKYVPFSGRFTGLFSLFLLLACLRESPFSLEPCSLLRYAALFLASDNENFGFSTLFFVFDIELTGIFSIPATGTTKEQLKTIKYEGHFLEACQGCCRNMVF